jgi:hypothetical protein
LQLQLPLQLLLLLPLLLPLPLLLLLPAAVAVLCAPLRWFWSSLPRYGSALVQGFTMRLD